jgi:hypothetical protein
MQSAVRSTLVEVRDALRATAADAVSRVEKRLAVLQDDVRESRRSIARSEVPSVYYDYYEEDLESVQVKLEREVAGIERRAFALQESCESADYVELIAVPSEARAVLSNIEATLCSLTRLGTKVASAMNRKRLDRMIFLGIGLTCLLTDIRPIHLLQREITYLR